MASSLRSSTASAHSKAASSTPTTSNKPTSSSSTTIPSHWVGNPPTAFRNPWPSYSTHTPLELLQTRFGRDRNFVPVPATRDELVPVRKPDWGEGREAGLRATWIGHASFFVETSVGVGAGTGTGKGEGMSGGKGERGVRILFDPVWSERTSPVQWFGPKRYTPVPCPLADVPPVDLVVISHNHYDHADTHTLQALHRRRQTAVRFVCPLGNAAYFHGLGIPPAQVFEFDWWAGDVFTVPGVGSVRLTCTPSQHQSGRGVLDQSAALWSSWVLEEVDEAKKEEAKEEAAEPPTDPPITTITPTPLKKLFFAGDTGYRGIPSTHPPDAPEDALPTCPAFAAVGTQFGPFDLALLPIGLYSPRRMLAHVHCNAADAVALHFALQSRKSIGMHWGTVRGGISAQYEDVREPPRKWKEEALRKGLRWGKEKEAEAGLLDVGETVVV